MDLRPVGFLLGFLIAALGASMLVPLGVAALTGDGEALPLLAASLSTLFLAGLLILGLRMDRVEIDRRQGFLLTSLAWIVLPALGALPFVWSDYPISATDGVFESVSGITTTGSTVLSGLDVMDRSILLWRSMLQWLGGIGIIAMGIAILPFLKVGGMEIFRMESSDTSEKAAPRVSQLAAYLVGVYFGLTVLCGVAYWAAGMTGFEALNHAMTTVSTGGFSTSDASMGHFTQPAIHWLGSLFMLLGSLPFVLYVRIVRGEPKAFRRDSQAASLLLLLGVASLIISVYLVMRDGLGWMDAIRHAVFNVTSIVSTTGYASDDYGLWGPFAVAAFFFLTFAGGCSGSTAGGFKIYRLQVLALTFIVSMRKLIRPHGAFVARIGAEPIDRKVSDAVLTFIVAYFVSIVGIALGLAGFGLDFDTAVSAAATAVANVGPGIGQIIGPAGNFATLPDGAKWILCLGMLLGRLEVLTIVVLFMPDFWRP